MKAKLLSPIKITSGQREWLELESDRTCETFAAIIRKLLQKQVDTESRKQSKEGTDNAVV
jgi:hypothetical protein